MADSRVIHHYPAGSSPEIHMVPPSAKIIGAAVRPRGAGIAVYIEHWGGEPSVPMEVVVVPTGEFFVHPGLDHIATLVDGWLVFHVYGVIRYG